MDEETTWAIYFAGIASLKFHPRNVMVPGEVFEDSALAHSAHVADKMLKLHKERYPCRGSQEA